MLNKVNKGVNMPLLDIEVFFPDKKVTNKDLEDKFSIDLSAMSKKVGINNRYVAKENETAVDLGIGAAQKVLKNSKLGDIDFLLFCTQSPDYFLPTSACIIQDRLGLQKNIGALDYNLGCSGYVYGLALAKGLLVSGVSSELLLVTSDTYSKHIHDKDKANQYIFGDGAAATLLKKGVQIGEFVFGTDGSGAENLIVKNGCFRNPTDPFIEPYEYGSGNLTDNNHLYMNGPEIFNFTIENIPSLVKSILIKNDCDIESVDYFIFHQANKYMLNHLRKKIRIPEDKFYNNLEDTGNTVSSTIPIALYNSIKNEYIKDGDKVMLVGFGVGLSLAGTIITI